MANLAKTQGFTAQLKDDQSARRVFYISTRMLAAKLYMRGDDVVSPQPLPTLKEKADEIRELIKGTEAGRAFAELEKQAKDGDPTELFEHILRTREMLKKKSEGSN